VDRKWRRIVQFLFSAELRTRMGLAPQGGTIFIAYSHQDRMWESRVATQLRVLQHARRRMDVWDDRRIGAGEDWLRKIDEAIERARVAILLISAKFLTSEFITRKEIPEILRRQANDGLTVIPLVVTPCGWETVPWVKDLNVRPEGGKALSLLTKPKADAALARLALEVRTICGPTAPRANTPRGRVHAGSLKPTCDRAAQQGVAMTVGTARTVVSRLHRFPVGRPIPLPCFFPSASGAAKSLLSPLDHLRLIVALRFPCFLASVYDFAHARREERLKMVELIERAVKHGQVVLLDSGLYERTWLRDPKWTRREFQSTLAGIRCHLGFSYDDVRDTTPRPGHAAAARIAAQVLRDRRKTDLSTLFPIIHVARPKDLARLAQEVAIRLDSDIIAVTERELGDGILDSAEVVLAIRHALNETGRYRVLHILGTGNPLSILIYSACGADSFDGLDWCQTVADRESKRLYHSRQLDFFANQSSYAREPGLRYSARMLAHNLDFYRDWMGEIQRRRLDGGTRELLRQVLPEVFCERLIALLDARGGGS
jgi:hypothetical protein